MTIGFEAEGVAILRDRAIAVMNSFAACQYGTTCLDKRMCTLMTTRRKQVCQRAANTAGILIEQFQSMGIDVGHAFAVVDRHDPLIHAGENLPGKLLDVLKRLFTLQISSGDDGISRAGDDQNTQHEQCQAELPTHFFRKATEPLNVLCNTATNDCIECALFLANLDQQPARGDAGNHHRDK